MKKLLVMMIASAMCAASALCAQDTGSKSKAPAPKAYERASDKASFKRTVESKGKTARKGVEAQKKPTENKSKGKKKGFLWW